MNLFIKRLKLFSLSITLVAASLMTIAPVNTQALSGSDFSASRIIDDHIFFDSNTLGVSDIQAFLNSKVPTCDTNHAQSSSPNDPGPPYTCLKGYSQNTPSQPADQYCSGAVSGGVKTAAQIIKDVSVACSVSPKVLLVLLQKEQSLISDTWPWPIQYTKATGFGCPDTSLPVNVDGNQNGCYDDFEGFFNQIYYAARQYQRYAKQSGSFGYRALQNNYIQYHPNAGCSGTTVFIQNQATAGLYNYTPYQPNAAALNNLYGTGDGCSAYGNRNFWRLYSDWFGSTISGKCLNGYNSGAPTRGVGFRKIRRHFDSGNLALYTDTQSGCVESHTWNYNFTNWESNNASNSPTVNPADSTVKFADLNGDGIDEAILVWLTNTPSGMVEFHVWDTTMKSWIVKAASNLPSSSLAGVAIDFADINGDGKDEPLAFGYSGTSTGKVEVHIWWNSITTWGAHTTTNLPVIDPMNMQIGFSNFDGSGPDEMVAFGINNTVSGKIEFHLWNQGFQTWRSHHVSNHGTVNASNSSIYFADLDGNSVDSAILVHNKGTSSGRVEFNVWKSSLGEWEFNSASNLPASP